MFLPKSYSFAEQRPCDVCDASDFEHLCNLRNGRIPDYAPPVAICRNCGFVTINPRTDSAQYKQINGRWYPFKFSVDNPLDSDEEKKFGKWKIMWRRIQEFYPEGPSNLLDIGAGQGWAIEYVQHMFPDMNAVAIEQWGPSQDYIRDNLGAAIVDIDINSDWPKNLHNQFDLAIFRHTLEHLEEPLKALQQIADCLSPDGHAYIAVPNAMAIQQGAPVRTNFFRPIHLHYFNCTTMVKLAARAGLTATALQDGKEIWGLFRRNGTDVKAVEPPMIDYTKQREFVRNRLNDGRWLDIKTEMRMALRWSSPITSGSIGGGRQEPVQPVPVTELTHGSIPSDNSFL
jgi:SAM-dependent methyltransferase